MRVKEHKEVRYKLTMGTVFERENRKLNALASNGAAEFLDATPRFPHDLLLPSKTIPSLHLTKYHTILCVAFCQMDCMATHGDSVSVKFPHPTLDYSYA